MDLLTTIETSAFAQALRGSFYVYPLVNALHVVSIGCLFTCVLLMDLRLLGAFQALPAAAFVTLLRRAALLGFAGALASGGAMAAVRITDYAQLGVFQLKMGLILLAGVNFAVFARKALTVPVTGTRRLQVVLSMLLWTGVVLAGRFIGYQ